MRKFKIVFMLVLVVTLGLILKSCLGDPYTYEDYMIKVDSIHIPGKIILHTPFDIDFFGIVGFDGCHSFKTYNQTTTTDNTIIIEAWGNYESKGACPAVLVTLESHKLNMTFHTPGTYTIKIQEPDNSSIVQQLTVN